MTDNNKINESMLDILKMEMDTQTKKILVGLDSLNSENAPVNTYESLINHTRAIKGAVNLVNINILKPVVESLESSFSHLQSIKHKLDDNSKTIIKDTITILTEIASYPVDKLNSPADVTLEEIESIITKLQSLNTKTALVHEEKPEAPEKTNTEDIIFSIAEKIDAEMFVLFCTELKNSIETINENLLDLDNNDKNKLESMMRAAHSIKGAARMIGIEAVVKLAHAIEDVFVAAQNNELQLNNNSIDQIFVCNDVLIKIEEFTADNISIWSTQNSADITKLINSLIQILANEDFTLYKPPSLDNSTEKNISPNKNTIDSMVRVSTERIDKLVSLSGELMVSSNWVEEHANSLRNLKKKQNGILNLISELQNLSEESNRTEIELKLISDIQLKSERFRDIIGEQLFNLDNFERRSSSIHSQISHEIIASRMRPFKDNIQGYKRMVRDISNSLNKKIKLDIQGLETPIDRDILEKLDAPINHMIRNSIDHGIETPEERIKKDKPEIGTITLMASHQSGRLKITIKDDGRGVDIEDIRQKVLERKLVNQSMAEKLSKSELLDFLFLPAFSTRSEVTELSGRGVGLDIVHSALQQVRGKLHADTELDKGMEINMELPLTLSVIRSLLVSINKELYAFPLAKIQSLISVNKQNISTLEDKQYITINDKHIGLVHCSQILGLDKTSIKDENIPVIIIGNWNMSYGIVVDELIGERKLALRQLNKKFGKIKDISSAAITDDGDPVLIFDIDDLQQSIQDIISGKSLYKVDYDSQLEAEKTKRVLVVDDSLTVREIEKKLLESRGYLVDTAIDGVDGWNAIRNGDYNLIITDVDMPRMNGIELITMIKNDNNLNSIPVMMVSYKDRAEDKSKGLEAGADYYLTKGSFHDDTLIEAVTDLIGEAQDD